MAELDEEVVMAVAARSALAALDNACDLLCLLTTARPELKPGIDLIEAAIQNLERHITRR